MKANAAINNIPSVTMNPDLQKRFIAEAKFLRALYYFNLVRFFWRCSFGDSVRDNR